MSSAVSLPSVLTFEQATAVAAWLRAAAQVETSLPFVLDASALHQFNTAALAVILEAGRYAQQSGRSMQIQQAPQALRELAQLYGVAELLQLTESAIEPSH